MVAVYVGGTFPSGEDRIAAYRMAEQISEKWVQSLKKIKATDEENMGLSRAKTINARILELLSQTKIEFLLRQNKLDSLIDYASNPSDLIGRLYSAFSSIAHLSGNLFSNQAVMCSEIVECIARQYKLDLERLKHKLLQKLLILQTGNPIDSKIHDEIQVIYYGSVEVCKNELASCAYSVILNLR